MAQANAQAKAFFDSLAGSGTAPYVVEDWRDGSSWTRKWSDGLIEQGGRFIPAGSDGVKEESVPLFVPYSSTDYFVSANYESRSDNAYGQCYKLTTSGFTCKGFARQRTCWYARGY